MQLKRRFLFLALVATVIFVNLNILPFNRKVTKELKGPPYVKGWYQNTSKNVKDYISEHVKPHILPKNFCDKNFELVVIVHSKINNFRQRQTIRETWGQKDANLSLYFLTGEDSRHNNEINRQLRDESEKYNDIIQERFIDSYNNLTLKSINMLKLFHVHCAKSYNYLMKIDDDMYFLVDNLLKVLDSFNRTNLLLGKLMADTKPIRNPKSKWYAPIELYPEDRYPPYLCGPAYLMSRDVVEKLYFCTYDTPIFHIEDTYITGMCARKVNVTPIHHPKFTCFSMKKYICPHRYFFTLHHYTPKKMVEAYNMLKNDGCPAYGSLWEWILTALS